MTTSAFPWLTVLWAVPMLGAAIIILAPAAASSSAEPVA